MNTEFYDLNNNTNLGNSKTECVGEYAISSYAISYTNDEYNADYALPDYFYVYDLSGTDNTLTIYKYSSVDTKYFSYSYNAFDWTNVDTSGGNITISLPANEKVYIKGRNDILNEDNKGVRINCSRDFGVGGILNYIIGGYDGGVHQYAFQGLFIGSNIVESHKLKITSTNNYSYYNFFYGCNNLVTTPQFCDTVSPYCYYQMFYKCGSLTTAPALPATNLAERCYCGMFQYCTNLTTAPALPATNLASGCYNNMFAYCSSLTTPPALPATTLSTECYYGMFRDCTSLSAAPILQTTTITPGCYSYMFQNCRSLINAPALPATTLDTSCYAYMFYGCSSLVNPPSLPATTLVQSCYAYMFQNCSALTTAPALPATTLANNCYSYMFYGCSSLNSAPELPATILMDSCYIQMFRLCTSLETAPALPATTLANSCYDNMFTSCSHLTNAPALPATTLTNNCYRYMFNGCTSLTTAPELPATTLAGSCYAYMFSGCTHLNYIKVDATAWNTSNASNWVQNVAASGTFEKPTGVSITTGNNGIPTGWTVQEYTPPTPQPNPSLIIHNTSGESNTISLLRQGSPAAVTIKYSTNGTNYTSFTTSSNLVVTLSAGESLYIDGTLKSSSNSAYYHITGTKAHTVEGELIVSQNYHYNQFFINDTTLTDASQLILIIVNDNHSYCYQKMFQGCTALITPPQLPSPTISSYCYTYMFSGCTSLTTAPQLPATTLQQYCYQYMFQNCASLTTAPALPATTLNSACYSYMFSGCSSLINPPSLPATSMNSTCYQYMFQNCTSLTTAPDLPATTLNNSCYYGMFQGCTALINPPTLPATSLSSGCYTRMFQNCTSLTSAPALPATVLASNCYSSMFNGCSSLTTAPALHSTILAFNCYNYMFQNCTSLTTAPDLPATTLASGCYSYMFNGCSSLVTVPILPAINITNDCYNYMFQNCTSLVNIPSILPATTLYQNCYQNMFQNCTSLTTAPDLPATTLASGCYSYMFYGCTSISNAPSILPATTLVSQCYYYMFYNCTSLTTAPELPAPTLTTSCYQSMFQNCTHLNYIKVGALTWNTSYAINWVGNVASSGTFVQHPAATWSDRSTSAIPTNWTILKDSYENYPLFIMNTSGLVNTISIAKTAASSPTFEIECSTDGTSYFSVGTTSTTPIEITMQPDTLIYLRASTTSWNGISIWGSENHKVCGNILSLLYGSNFSPSNTTFNSNVDDDTFKLLFFEDTTLEECKNLILPTNTKAGCYNRMFYGCTAITTAPVLPATTLTESCYQEMFRNCSNLTKAPALPATTLANSCYSGMFRNCTSITKAPMLEATTLYSNCYQQMFMGCSSLNNIDMLNLTTAPTSAYTSSWVDGVAATGTFYKNPDANWTTGVNGIPTGWTVKTEKSNFDALFAEINTAYPNRLKWIHQNYSVNDDELCYVTIESGMSRTSTKTLVVGDRTGILQTKTVTVSGWGAYMAHNAFAYHGYFGFVGRTNDSDGSSAYLSLFKYENGTIDNILTGTTVNTGNWTDYSLSCFTFNGKDYVQSVSNSSRQTFWYYNLTDRTFSRTEVSNKRVGGCMIEPYNSNLMYLIAAVGTDSTEGLRVNQMSSVTTPALGAVSNVLNGWNNKKYRKTPVAFGDVDYRYLVFSDEDAWYDVTISNDYSIISINRAFDVMPTTSKYFKTNFMLVGDDIYFSDDTYTGTDIVKL